MPSPDPIPSPHGATTRQLWRTFRLLVLLGFVVTAIAVVLISRGDSRLHIYMVIATALGAFMIVLVGAGLMALVFISNSSGHDDAAASFHRENHEE